MPKKPATGNSGHHLDRNGKTASKPEVAPQSHNHHGMFGVDGTHEKAGWLNKWTNYLKGYRRRWFVLDPKGNLSYYRNPSDVGLACKGSVNLREAKIYTDVSTNALVISNLLQSFHLKAQNDIERVEWFQALEFAHRTHLLSTAHTIRDVIASTVIKSCETGSTRTGSHVSRLGADGALITKFSAMKTAHDDVVVRATALKSRLAPKSNGVFDEGSEANTSLRESVDDFLKSANELMNLVAKELEAMSRYASNEHEQKMHLQEQLETLAHQHSQLEQVAFGRGNASGIEQPPYADGEEDEVFHDVAKNPEELRVMNEVEDARKSGSSRQASICGDSDQEIFNAEIVINHTDDRTQLTAPTVIKLNEGGEKHTAVKQRRTSVPERPLVTLNLWSIMKNCIGKELTKIPMPVNFNEPLSVCQRITEDLEYAQSLLDIGAECTDACEQMCYVAAYAISCYSTTTNRTTKPFNPLLGETYECDRWDDLGWRSLTEQVSHHPPTTAHHAEGRRGWTMFQEITMTSKFRGKYLSVTPGGQTHVRFKNNAHYTYKKITTTVHNIIVGKLWIDNHGEMNIVNHTDGSRGTVKFNAYSYFSLEKPRRVNGVIRDENGVPRYLIQGYWDRYIDMLKVNNYQHHDGDRNTLETGAPKRIWTINPPYPNSEKMYFFTRLAIELNEEDDSVAPTDSRRRPDQRLMEQGDWDSANRRKNELEEKQRRVRKQREEDAEKAIEAGLTHNEYQPQWFKKDSDELTNSLFYKYSGNYWESKERGDWTCCQDIFD